MHLTVRTDEPESADELYRWLLEDPELASAGEITPASETDRPGEMGDPFTILGLVVPAVLGLGSLIMSILSYRESRKRSTGEAPQVTITYLDVTVVVEGDGSQARRALERRLEPEPGTAAAGPVPEPAAEKTVADGGEA